MAVGVVVIKDGKELFVGLCDTEEQMRSITLKELNKKILDKLKLQYPDWSVRVKEILFKGKPLEGDTTLLSDHGIQHMSSVNVKAIISRSEPEMARLPFCPIRLFEEKPDDQKRKSLEYAADFEHQFELPDQHAGN